MEANVTTRHQRQDCRCLGAARSGSPPGCVKARARHLNGNRGRRHNTASLPVRALSAKTGAALPADDQRHQHATTASTRHQGMAAVSQCAPMTYDATPKRASLRGATGYDPTLTTASHCVAGTCRGWRCGSRRRPIFFSGRWAARFPVAGAPEVSILPIPACSSARPSF
jgi:hypothetical protein